MALSSHPDNRTPSDDAAAPSLHRFLLYFFKPGCLGFCAALVGCMNRDLVERKHRTTEDACRPGFVVCRICPGSIAALHRHG